jgi:hypothetical protein
MPPRDSRSPLAASLHCRHHECSLGPEALGLPSGTIRLRPAACLRKFCGNIVVHSPIACIGSSPRLWGILPSAGPHIGKAPPACDHGSMGVHFFLLAGAVVTPSSLPFRSIDCMQRAAPGCIRGPWGALQRTRREALLLWSHRYFCGRQCAMGRDRLPKDAAAERPETKVRGGECGMGEGGDTGPLLHVPGDRRCRGIRTEGAGLQRRV